MKNLVVFFSVFCLIFLSGCKTGYREIDRGYLVSAIGFEQQENFIQIYIEALSSSDIESESIKRIVLNGQGDTFDSAFKNLRSQIVKPLYFEQLGSAVFSPVLLSEGISFLQNLPNTHWGIFVVQIDNVATLFESEPPNGMWGYDIIGFIKTNGKKSFFSNQLFNAKDNYTNIPKINFTEGKLVLLPAGDNYDTK